MPGSDGLAARRPRILLIGGDGGLTGVPRYLMQMVQALHDSADITVLSDVHAGGFDRLQAAGVRHIVVEGLRTSRSPFLAAKALWRLRTILAAEEFDLVWAHARMAVILSRLVMIRPDRGGTARFAITHHGLPFEDGYPWPYAMALRMWERAMLRLVRPHHIFVLTDRAKARYCAAVPLDTLARHRLHVFQSCSRLNPLPSVADPAGPRRLIMTGRDSHQKNLPAALQLFAHLPDRYHLVLCGPGTDGPAFRGQMSRILTPAQQARVTLMGPLSDIRPELARASGYLLTSRYEGLPLGALEAWEAGLPLAMVRIDGTADILSRHPLVTVLDAGAGRDLLQQAQAVDRMISRYLDDTETWSDRIRQTWAEQHAFSPWAENLRCLVRQMLETRD